MINTKVFTYKEEMNMKYRKGLESSLRAIDLLYIEARNTKDENKKKKLIATAQLMVAELRH